MTPGPNFGMTEHFAVRVRERIGNEKPIDLARGICSAIAEGRTDLVQYEGRSARPGRRFFRFRVRDGREFIAVVDTERGRFLTVISPEMVMA